MNVITQRRESFERGWFTSEGRHRLTIRDGSIAQVVAAGHRLQGDGATRDAVADSGRGATWSHLH